MSARCPCALPPAPGPRGIPTRGAASSGPGVRALPSPPLLRFLVRLVLVAPRAELLPLRPLRVLAPVLRGEVVPAFAHGAFHDDVFPRHCSALLQDLGGHAGADGAAAFADRKPQLL